MFQNAIPLLLLLSIVWSCLFLQVDSFTASSRISSGETMNAAYDTEARALLDKVYLLIPTNVLETKHEILAKVRQEHAADVQASNATLLAREDELLQSAGVAPTTDLTYQYQYQYQYQWVTTSTTANNRSAAVLQTIGEPLLTSDERQQIRTAADHLWKNQNTTASRFTYQRPGNYEAHLAELQTDLKIGVPPATPSLIANTLLSKIYPMVRRAFQLEDYSGTAAPLCVYDALVIRYNATQAVSGQGAGQPLHRDLGLVSVNLQLNSHLEFQGGGTWFENHPTDYDKIKQPLKPVSAGHALAHFSSERHAGAATTKGVRDILVLFLLSTQPTPMELCARLKGQPSALSRCLAIEQVPTDGEAWHYLGMAIQQENPETALQCLRYATQFTPRDARLYNNLGLVLNRLGGCPIQSYERSIELHTLSQSGGCQVDADLDSVLLNYGLYLSNKDEFAPACNVLERVSQGDSSRIQRDAAGLLRFCRRKHLDNQRRQ
jgi:hypothetical protein